MDILNEKLKKLNEKFEGKAKNNDIPKRLKFIVKDGGELTAVCQVSEVFAELRKIDPWLMVFVDAIETEFPDRRLYAFRIELGTCPDKCDLESFRRRLSYLALNNGWHGSLLVAGKEEKIYQSDKELLERPDNEVVDDKVAKRNDSDDSNGKIEKNFQTWLAGEHRENNERLAVLGKDFENGGKAPVLREFPVGVFNQAKGNDSRLISKGWIDLVSLNKHGELALIELKVNDKKLDVIAQALDYALFFACYRTSLFEYLSMQGLVPLSQESTIRCYIANNTFHPQFEKITPYYAPCLNKWPFSFAQIFLGETKNF